jgi:hypothetical protein
VTSAPIGYTEFRIQSCTEAEPWHKFDGESDFIVITPDQPSIAVLTEALFNARYDLNMLTGVLLRP